MMSDGVYEWPPAFLRRYRGHKVVRAVKIAGVEVRKDGSALIAVDLPASDADEGASEAETRTFETGSRWADLFQRGCEDVTDPGYYVLYEDGYESWSPTADFEAGYTLIGEE